MEQMRSEFEAWFTRKILELAVFAFPDFVDGEYTEDDKYDVEFYQMLQAMWMAWQASRAAIEIEAPEFIGSREALTKGFTVDYSNGFGDGMDAYEANIRAAGLRVKEK